MRKYDGKKFAITGDLSFPRRGALKMLVRAGGIYTERISKELDYLVAASNGGSRYDKALALGVKILTEQEFVNMMGFGPEEA